MNYKFECLIAAFIFAFVPLLNASDYFWDEEINYDDIFKTPPPNTPPAPVVPVSAPAPNPWYVAPRNESFHTNSQPTTQAMNQALPHPMHSENNFAANFPQTGMPQNVQPASASQMGWIPCPMGTLNSYPLFMGYSNGQAYCIGHFMPHANPASASQMGWIPCPMGTPNSYPLFMGYSNGQAYCIGHFMRFDPSISVAWQQQQAPLVPNFVQQQMTEQYTMAPEADEREIIETAQAPQDLNLMPEQEKAQEAAQAKR